MALAHRRKSDLAFFKETTAGSPPASWATSGRPVKTVGPVDLSAAEQQLIEDERSVTRIFELGGQKVKGLRGQFELPFRMYLSGKDGTDATVVQTYLMDLLENALGGIKLGANGSATGGSTTTVTLADVSAYEVGEVIGVIDTSAADNIVYPRRITTKAGTTLTIDEALPFTVVSGDLVKGAATIYFDQDVLENSGGAASRTLSFHGRRGNDADARLELLGCVLNLGIEGLGAGELMAAAFAILPAFFLLPGDTGVSGNPGAFSNATQGGAPIAMAPRTKVWFQDYGSTAQTTALSIAGLNVDVGLKRAKTPAVTSQTDNMEAMHAWSVDPGSEPPSASFQVNPHSVDYNTDLVADTFKAFRVARLGTEGNVVAFTFPRAEVSMTPKTNENGPTLATQVTIRGHEDTDAIGTTDIAKSPFSIALI